MKSFFLVTAILFFALIIKYVFLGELTSISAMLDYGVFILVSGIVFILMKNNGRFNKVLKNRLNRASNKLNKTYGTIEKLYYYDSLTKLPNRNKLLEKLSANEYKAMVLTNIDNFKEVNEFYGYKMGDYIIVELGVMIKGYFEGIFKIDLYRMPGDEFAICFKEEISTSLLLRTMKDVLIQTKRKVFTFEEASLQLNISLGGSTKEGALLQYSDIALKKAQDEFSECFCLDEDFSIKDDLENNIEWTKKIREAIKNDKIVPFFQPIYSNVGKKIVKYECLVRLIDEEDNVISPFFFLDKAVKAKLYFKITKIMIAKCFNYFRDIDMEFSINLSYLDIINKDVKKFLMNHIKTFPNPKQINIELLESEEIENYEVVKGFIEEVKKYGCKVAIDDFGVGYSNFNHIVELNIDIIKIDASLVKGIVENKNLEIIVETISSFAKKIGVQSVGEFVYSKEVSEKLMELGVSMSQGFYFGKPLKDILPTDQPILEG